MLGRYCVSVEFGHRLLLFSTVVSLLCDQSLLLLFVLLALVRPGVLGRSLGHHRFRPFLFHSLDEGLLLDLTAKLGLGLLRLQAYFL